MSQAESISIITDLRCTEYAAPGHPERPSRVRDTLARLRQTPPLPIDWDAPVAPQEAQLLRAHSIRHLGRVRAAQEAFDGDTPNYPGIWDHAQRSVGGALRALELARLGKLAFSLMRPPGHHATPDQAMGFCYLNAVAIAVLEGLESGIERIALLDFDVHHGNGSEAILVRHPHARFFSIHQHPCYPGTGTAHVGSNCFNYPVAPRTPRLEHRAILARAIESLKQTRPGMIAVSAGFDAFSGDPIAQELLEAEDFQWLGSELWKSGIPFFSLLEGGYSDELPLLVEAYIKGASGR